MTQTKIHLLQDDLINQIKAGEVIERPYNVVKELVENSIDAQAKNIHVEILDGGKQLIRISDDGFGIAQEDMALALERHATSKISQFSDLHRLTSFGFRGEALPSIASVSHFSMKSKQEAEELGSEITVDGGKKVSQKDLAMNRGTIISVRDLFFNVPARLKFLKSTSTEFSHINDFLTATSLCYPNISFRFSHNGRDIFSYKEKTSLTQRFEEIIGPESKKYVPIQFERGSFKILGYSLLPEYAKTIPQHFVTFINGRFVKDKVIRSGVLQAYEGLLLKGLLPGAFIFVTLDPSMVDINAHPSKTEVRFYDPLATQEWIAMGIQDGLKKAIQKNMVTSSPHMAYAKCAPPPSTRSDIMTSRVDMMSSRGLQLSPRGLTTGSSRIGLDPAAWPRDDNILRRDDTIPPPVLFQEKKNAPFDRAKYLGQFSNCYLIVEMNNELCLIDQHAFHERILFEEFMSMHNENTIARQSVLTPILVSVNSESLETTRDYQEKIHTVGFEIEILKNNQIAIHSYPAFLNIEKVPQVFEEMLSKLVINSDAFHLVFATFACHSAVRSGDPLNEELALRLLKRAGDVDFYAHCPHGRPVIRKFSQRDVESWFQRI